MRRNYIHVDKCVWVTGTVSSDWLSNVLFASAEEDMQ